MGHLWVPVTNAKANEKTRQALREGIDIRDALARGVTINEARQAVEVAKRKHVEMKTLRKSMKKRNIGNEKNILARCRDLPDNKVFSVLRELRDEVNNSNTRNNNPERIHNIPNKDEDTFPKEQHGTILYSSNTSSEVNIMETPLILSVQPTITTCPRNTRNEEITMENTPILSVPPTITCPSYTSNEENSMDNPPILSVPPTFTCPSNASNEENSMETLPILSVEPC